MSARFSVQVLDSSGNAQTGQNVDLYEHGGSKVADMTDNGDGTYYCDVSETIKGVVYVNGSAQAEQNGVIVVADDILTLATDIDDKADKVSGATTGNLAGLDANGNLTDSGVAASGVLDSDHAQANGAGGTTALSTNRVHHAQAIQLQDVAGRWAAADLESLADEIGDDIGAMSFGGTTFCADIDDLTNAIIRLDNAVLDAMHRAHRIDTETNAYAFTFEKSGAQSGNVYMADVGFPAPSDGYIAKYIVHWSAASIGTGNTIGVGYNSSNILSILDGEESNLKKIGNFNASHNYHTVGDVIRPRIATSGGDTITDPCITIIFMAASSPVDDFVAQGGNPT